MEMELELNRRERAVLIVDGQPLFRTALHGLLDIEPYQVVEAASARAALELANSTTFDLAIVDATLGGIALLAHLHVIQPACRLLGVASDDNPYRVARMMRAGASGCALKIQPADELVDAIHIAIDGARYVPPILRGEAFDRLLTSDDEWPLDRLTPREREVFCLVADGGGNSDIAAKLFISKRTVETHRQRIMTKLGARSLADLIKVARAYELA
jgi:DNA-binding NarL/FixJ family response regulator